MNVQYIKSQRKLVRVMKATGDEGNAVQLGTREPTPPHHRPPGFTRVHLAAYVENAQLRI